MTQAQPAAEAAPRALGVFDHAADVGSPALAGSTYYDAATDTYRITGAGHNMWYGEDEHQFAWKEIEGDFIVDCQVAFLGPGADPHRKIGWIARPSLDKASPQVSAVIHGDGLTSLQYRDTAGADSVQVELPSGANVVRLERRGDRFTMSAAQYGEELQSVDHELELPERLLVGLFVCSHVDAVHESAVFSNVRVTLPVDPGFTPYRDYIGSNLELMEVDTGRRRVIHREEDSVQAPNWTLDGKRLLYNRNGLLYYFDLATSEVTQLDTGSVTDNNNDHVFSFDGRTLGISAWTVDPGVGRRSIVYTLPAEGPAEGGEPTRITPQGHSYLHGFSPDGKRLVYTAGRNDAYDIHTIPVEGGEETNLTNLATLDDGAEFSPDGRYIYFNSARTGSMELWRMGPNGENPEQLTDDPEHQNWFPHLSPDGSRLVYISFPSTVDVNEHPFYERVTLRLMDADGGPSKTIAYLYGGQGTINVPSWSPDGKRIAFVSNSR